MAIQNKKILCFLDKCGIAGAPGFALGCVMAWAHECGRADKSFSDLLEPNANELHAVDLSKGYLQGLLARYAHSGRPKGMILMNRLGTASEGTAPAIYAGNVIETVKVAIGQFREFHTMQGQRVGNVELILDRNHHNTDPECQRLISKAYLHDGRFRAVSCISQIDSSASRLLQLADVVAYARTWIHRGEENAKGLHEKFGCVRLTDASAAGASPAERKGSHHFHREPCAGHREVSGEASVAACTGRAKEPRKS